MTRYRNWRLRASKSIDWNRPMLRRAGSQRPLMNVRVGGADEVFEQRMRLVRFAAEFGMKLAGDEKRVVQQFDHLDQLAVGRGAAEDEIRFLELVAVGVVEFVAVTVPFVDDERAVEFGRQRTHHQLARLCPQP